MITVLAALLLVTFWHHGDGEQHAAGGQSEIRVVYFPNVTHAPAMVGLANGIWSRKLVGYSLSTRVVDAGPEAMTALLSNDVDFCFVGPSPVINTYLKSKGEALRVVSGACLGGASLIRRRGVAIGSVRGLDGKRVAVPQLGGTQDVSCRHFLAQNGLKPLDQGGTVEIMPVKNPDILALFKQGHLDAAWVPEAWASRIKAETGAETVVDERDLWPGRDFCATLLVVRRAYLDAHPDIVRQVLGAHLDTLSWMAHHEVEAKKVFNAEFKRLRGRALTAPVLDEAWSRVTFTSDPSVGSVRAFAEAAANAGYLKDREPDLTDLFKGSSQP